MKRIIAISPNDPDKVKYNNFNKRPVNNHMTQFKISKPINNIGCSAKYKDHNFSDIIKSKNALAI